MSILNEQGYGLLSKMLKCLFYCLLFSYNRR